MEILEGNHLAQFIFTTASSIITVMATVIVTLFVLWRKDRERWFELQQAFHVTLELINQKLDS